MPELTALTNDELLQKIASYNRIKDLANAKQEILGRITPTTEADEKLVDAIIIKAAKIEDADLDLLRQSDRLRTLNREYDDIKKQLLARMDTKPEE